MNKPKNFCAVPFQSLEITGNGGCDVCCKRSQTNIRDPNGHAYMLKKSSINEIWNSEYMKKLRQQFLNNEQPKECEQCYIDEETTGNSYRLTEYNKNVDLDQPKITEIIIKMSNLCNQACLTCSPFDSSLWRDEYIKNKIPLESIHYSPQMDELYRAKTLNDHNLLELVELSKNLSKLSVRGGEPTIHKELHHYIDIICQNNSSSNIHLIMNSNAMVFNSEFITNCSKFKKASILLSIDNIGAGYEYIRWPGNWQKIHGNILRYKKLNEPFEIQINTTISVLNILDIEKILDAFSEYELSVSLNGSFVFEPELLSARNMPNFLKEYATSKLEKINFEKYNKRYISKLEIKNLINFINYPPSDVKFQDKKYYSNSLIDHLALLDNSRKVYFKNSLPELYDLIHN